MEEWRLHVNAALGFVVRRAEKCSISPTLGDGGGVKEADYFFRMGET